MHMLKLMLNLLVINLQERQTVKIHSLLHFPFVNFVVVPVIIAWQEVIHSHTITEDHLHQIQLSNEFLQKYFYLMNQIIKVMD